MNRDTLLAQAGSRRDPATGAISVPVYHSATFQHPALGQSTGYDYSRSGNPTRAALEETLAQLEGGARACAFASGLAAIDAVLRLFAPGDTLIVSEDLYGGTFRLLEKIYAPLGLRAVYADTSDTAAVEALLAMHRDSVKAVFAELPTNPLLKVADLPALAQAAHERDALLIVDNTFLTPYLCRPFEHGADITVYSATKYLGGHNDVVSGVAIAKDAAIGERLAFLQNATGAILGPQDSWLLLRGLKTLGLRLERQQQNAQRIADYLTQHARVRKVFYPGLPGDPGHQRLCRQSSGFGAMVAFEVEDPQRIPAILSGVKTILFAESLGGVESLITFPSVQTHADISPEAREKLGINDRLLRLSVGIENIDDLLTDLADVL